MPKVWIGTSGWSYEHWKNGVFYPEDWKEHQLKYYQKFFDTVELNASFYHLPKKKTFENWRELVPENFIFAVKGSRYITHIKKLKEVEEPLNRLLDRARGLEDKLGPILFQFPPSWEIKLERLKKFLKLLPEDQRFTFEFRHPSWFCPEVYQLLSQYNAALALADTPNYPLVEEITTDFVYIRLHGHQQLYGSEYSQKELEKWAQKVNNWGRETFVYFDNDAQGYAPKNAQELKEIIERG